MLRCYLGDIDADLRGGLEELGWTGNPTEGKLKVGLAEIRNPTKRRKKCFVDLQSVKT